MRKKLFFLICFGLLFQNHVCGMYSKVKKGAFGTLDPNIISYHILAFLPFGEGFFEYVAKLHKGVPQKILGISLPEWIAKKKKCSFMQLLVLSCKVRPMVLEIYRDKVDSKEKNPYCVKRSGEWFWKNFKNIRKLLNGVLSETVLVFHYQPKYSFFDGQGKKACLSLRDLEKISSITNLKGLELNDCLLNDEEFVNYETSPFKCLKKLKNLWFLGLNMTLPVDALQGVLERIEILNLGGCCCMEGLDFLDKFKKLKALNLSNVLLNEEDIAFLDRSERLQQNLKELSLQGNKNVSFVKNFEFLAKFKNLQVLDLGCTRITSKELETIANSKKLQKNLRALDLEGCWMITSFICIAQFKNLRELILSHTRIKLKELIFIVDPNRLLDNLRILQFDSCESLPNNLHWSRDKGLETIKR